MSHSLDAVVALLTRIIGQAGYPGVFALMALEASCIPIPSEVTLVFAGFLVAQGRFTLAGAILAAVLGVVVGSTISYSVGRYGGRPFILRFGRFFLLNEHRLALTERWFARYGGKAVIICRLISGLRAIISLPAGLVRMSYPRFMAYTLAGSGTWVVIGVLLGFLVGEEWRRIIDYLQQAGHFALLLVVLAAVAAWYLHHRMSRVGEKPASPSEPAPPA